MPDPVYLLGAIWCDDISVESVTLSYATALRAAGTYMRDNPGDWRRVPANCADYWVRVRAATIRHSAYTDCGLSIEQRELS